MDKTRANKGGGGKGNQTLEELELELEDRLLEIDALRDEYAETRQAVFTMFGSRPPLNWNNTGVSFPDAGHPLSPACPNDPDGYDLEAAQIIVRLSLVNALQVTGCVLRQDATKAISSALFVTESQSRRLFNEPWLMSREQVETIALATKSTADDLRGVDPNILLRREASRLARHLSADSNLLRGDSLAAAVEILRGAEMAIRALSRQRG